jgi:flagellar FliJ protein
MKRYIFKLDPVLKVRKLKEENCRMELGKLISFLNRIEDQIKHDNSEIQNYYKIQEASLQNGIRGNQVQAFPMLIQAKEKNIQLLHRDKKEQERLIDLKKKELATLRGELKVLENLKEKDFDQYKKALNKEIDQKVEEQTQNWLQFNERKV